MDIDFINRCNKNTELVPLNLKDQTQSYHEFALCFNETQIGQNLIANIIHKQIDELEDYYEDEMFELFINNKKDLCFIAETLDASKNKEKFKITSNYVIALYSKSEFLALFFGLEHYLDTLILSKGNLYNKLNIYLDKLYPLMNINEKRTFLKLNFISDDELENEISINTRFELELKKFKKNLKYIKNVRNLCAHRNGKINNTFLSEKFIKKHKDLLGNNVLIDSISYKYNQRYNVKEGEYLNIKTANFLLRDLCKNLLYLDKFHYSVKEY